MATANQSMGRRSRGNLLVATMVAAGLSLAGSIARGNTVVEVLNCQASTQNAKILPLLEGKPIREVKLSITTPENKPVQFVSVNKRGIATLPTLPPGRYIVHALAADNRGAVVCLEISSRKVGSAKSFSLKLGVLPPPPLTFEDLLSAAESQPPRERLQTFTGVVQDPGTAIIPGSEIQIFPKGVHDQAHSILLKSDESGRFSTPLPDGSYVVVFQMPGFRTQFVTVEIVHDGEAKDLTITLQIGMST